MARNFLKNLEEQGLRTWLELARSGNLGVSVGSNVFEVRQHILNIPCDLQVILTKAMVLDAFKFEHYCLQRTAALFVSVNIKAFDANGPVETFRVCASGFHPEDWDILGKARLAINDSSTLSALSEAWKIRRATHQHQQEQDKPQTTRRL